MKLVREIFQDLRTAPLRAKILITVCVLYLINPIDLIPDFIPVIGQMDDAIVLGILMKTVSKYSRSEEIPIKLLLNKFKDAAHRNRFDK